MKRSTFYLAAVFLFPLKQPGGLRLERPDQNFALEGPGKPNGVHWRRAGLWLIVWGLLIGLAYTIVFRVAWRWFGEYQYIRFMPMACVLAVDLGWCGFRLMASAAVIADRLPPGGSNRAPLHLPALLAIILVTLLKYAMLLSLPMGVPLEPTEWGGWRSGLGILYPQPIYRPLILMPLWGRWAMMLALSIGRAAPEASHQLRAMIPGPGLPLIIAAWLACMLLTVFYLATSPADLGHGVLLALGMMVTAYLASFILARRCGGQTEATVGTTGLAAEMSFLALYLPISSHIFWY